MLTISLYIASKIHRMALAKLDTGIWIVNTKVSVHSEGAFVWVEAKAEWLRIRYHH